MICREAFDLRVIGSLIFVAGMVTSFLILLFYFYFANPLDACTVCGHRFRDSSPCFRCPICNKTGNAAVEPGDIGFM